MRSALFLLALFLTLLPSAAGAQAPEAKADITDLQTAAYLAIMRGDEAQAADQVPEALQAYQEALKAYQRIIQADPGFKPEIIKYRLAYCTNQIKELQARQTKQEPPELASTRAALKALQLKYQALESDAQALRQQGQAAREREQAALKKQQEAEAMATQALARAEKLSEALNRVAQDRGKEEQGAAAMTAERDRLLASLKEAEMRAADRTREAEALRQEAERLKTSLDAQASASASAGKMAGQAQEELTAAKARTAELEAKLAQYDAEPAVIAERLREMDKLRANLLEESARITRENDGLKAKLADLEKQGDPGEAMAREKQALEKQRAEAMAERDASQADLSKARGEIESLRALIAPASEHAARASNATARVLTLLSEGLAASNRIEELTLRLRERDRMAREAEARASASLDAQQARMSETMRAVEGNIARMKELEAANAELGARVAAAAAQAPEMDRLRQDAEKNRVLWQGAEQERMNAVAEVGALKTALARQEEEIRLWKKNETEMAKTLAMLQARLAEHERASAPPAEAEPAPKPDAPPARTPDAETPPPPAPENKPEEARQPPLPRGEEAPRRFRLFERKPGTPPPSRND